MLRKLLAGFLFLTPPFSVIDGDTFGDSTIRIRVWGIAAPELDERSGDNAKQALNDILSGAEFVVCVPRGASYRRIVARCFVNGTDDIGAELVSRGVAVDCPRYSGGEYSSIPQPGIPAPYYCVRPQ